MPTEAKINILVLAAGAQSKDSEFEDFPLCLTTFEGSTLLEKIIDKCNEIPQAKFAFSFLERQRAKFFLDDIVHQIVPDAFTVGVPVSTSGSACTALFLACQLDQTSELLIVSANEFLDLSLFEVVTDFRGRELDGGTLVFNSLDPHYSFVSLDDQNRVLETAQRRPISRKATTGIFWYKQTRDFVDGAMNMIRKDVNTDGRFYVAPVFNELILKNKSIGVFEIEGSKYTPLKTQQQLEQQVRRNHL